MNHNYSDLIDWAITSSGCFMFLFAPSNHSIWSATKKKMTTKIQFMDPLNAVNRIWVKILISATIVVRSAKWIFFQRIIELRNFEISLNNQGFIHSTPNGILTPPSQFASKLNLYQITRVEAYMLEVVDLGIQCISMCLIKFTIVWPASGCCGH